MTTFAPLGESLRSFSSNGELPLPFSGVRKGDAVAEEEEASLKTKHIEEEEKSVRRSRPNSSSSGRGAGGGGGSYAALLPKRAGEGVTVYPPAITKDFQENSKAAAPHAPSGVSRGLERRTAATGHGSQTGPGGGGGSERGDTDAERRT